MARTENLSCDICKKPCETIVAKMFYGPMLRGAAQAYHSNYTHHLDVGDCCGGGSQPKILKVFQWRPRMTQEQYLASRRRKKAAKAK